MLFVLRRDPGNLDRPPRIKSKKERIPNQTPNGIEVADSFDVMDSAKPRQVPECGIGSSRKEKERLQEGRLARVVLAANQVDPLQVVYLELVEDPKVPYRHALEHGCAQLLSRNPVGYR